MITVAWLKQIFSGKKELLKLEDVRMSSIPRFDEISVKNLYDDTMKLPGMSKYFPNEYPKGRTCDRKYFFAVLSTVHPEVTQDILRHSKNARFKNLESVEKGEAIAITPEWEDLLREFPAVSSK